MPATRVVAAAPPTTALAANRSAAGAGRPRALRFGEGEAVAERGGRAVRAGAARSFGGGGVIVVATPGYGAAPPQQGDPQAGLFKGQLLVFGLRCPESDPPTQHLCERGPSHGRH